jgi:ATP-dependent RNA helicase DDX19/DBP5
MSDLASRITKPDEAVEVQVHVEPPPEADAAALEGQVDGAVEELGGSGLQEPDWDVEVSLSDLQNNEATPFHSAAQWEDMGL